MKRPDTRNADAAVSLKNVSKTINTKPIVKDLSFNIHAGEVFGLLGPNGAGKTTTIRMMVGLISITEGEILIAGKSVKNNYQAAIQHVGAIVENPEFYKFLSGYDNLLHFARMMNDKIPTERIQEVIKKVGLESRIHDKVKTYSLGMRQRLGIAQALLHNPKVLILDEPTNGLDPAGIRELREYLRELAHEEGVAVIVSSHLLSEMEMMCDRVAVIQEGRLVDVRTIGEFIASAQDEANYLFEVDRLETAQEVIRKMGILPEGNILISQHGLQIRSKREPIADMIKELVDHEVKVYSVRPLVKTLEDKFLEVTGGAQIV